jgi:hypothetical protein
LNIDEDILANESSNGSTDPNQALKTPMQGPITWNHAKKIQQEVYSLLTKIDYNTNENFILSKYCTHVLLRFTHMEIAAGPKKMSYAEAEPSNYFLHQSHIPRVTCTNWSAPHMMHMCIKIMKSTLTSNKWLILLTSH